MINKVTNALLLSLAIQLNGCASPLPKAISQVPPTEIRVEEVRQQPERFLGSRVRWGGSIIQVENLPQHTLIELLSRPLSGNGKPDSSGRTQGRFLARIPGFLDPEEYPKERLLTISGTIAGTTQRTIGDYPYLYPLVESEIHHLWPDQREARDWQNRDPFYDPWYPWGSPWYRHPYYW
ncbi:membrane protein [Candidatus Endoriftia persephone str. Guaymas]|nr:membrane protein [Candidatus Endoriftia persephone str. Guaymas]